MQKHGKCNCEILFLNLARLIHCNIQILHSALCQEDYCHKCQRDIKIRLLKRQIKMKYIMFRIEKILKYQSIISLYGFHAYLQGQCWCPRFLGIITIVFITVAVLSLQTSITNVLALQGLLDVRWLETSYSHCCFRLTGIPFCFAV